MTEAITNGGFETGDFTGWENSGAYVIDWLYHSGAYSCQCYQSTIYQNMNVPVNSVSSFGFWTNGFAGSGPAGSITVYYSDETFTYVEIVVSGSWVYTNMLGLLSEGKTIIKVEFFGGSAIPFALDDVSLKYTPISAGELMIENGGGILSKIICIGWEEEQECNPAIRDIPTKTDGSVVDVGTYVLKPRKIIAKVRLSDSNKTTLQSIFNYSAMVYISIGALSGGTWNYTAWLSNKSLTWEYCKYPDERNWLTTLEFYCSEFSYLG